MFAKMQCWFQEAMLLSPLLFAAFGITKKKRTGTIQCATSQQVSKAAFAQFRPPTTLDVGYANNKFIMGLNSICFDLEQERRLSDEVVSSSTTLSPLNSRQIARTMGKGTNFLEDMGQPIEGDQLSTQIKPPVDNTHGTVANPHLPSRSISQVDTATRNKFSHEQTSKNEIQRTQQRSTAVRSRSPPVPAIADQSSVSTGPKSTTSTRRRRQEVMQSIRRMEIANTVSSSPLLIEPATNKSPQQEMTTSSIPNQEIEDATTNTQYRPGDEMVPRRSRIEMRQERRKAPSHEHGRHSDYPQQQSPSVELGHRGDDKEIVVEEEEEEPPMIEVSPGNFVPLRGNAAKTKAAVVSGTTIECFCYGCSVELETIKGVEMVMCVVCQTISPVFIEDDSGSSNNRSGLGLGMKKEDAIMERSRYDASKHADGRIS